jgi:hypothetical protein
MPLAMLEVKARPRAVASLEATSEGKASKRRHALQRHAEQRTGHRLVLVVRAFRDLHTADLRDSSG